ncbi:MAG TPA: hypothetical protein DCS67_10565 [Clostridiales bacterium UBA8960]|nr:hypothetical protein [Clostridiales bacterium UBA8960]
MALLGEVMLKSTKDFGTSVEFDLYQSDFGNTLLEEYHIGSQLGSGTTYLLIRKCDGARFVLKAISYCDNISKTSCAIAPFKCPGMMEIVRFAQTETYDYLILPYSEGIWHQTFEIDR